MFTYNRFWHFWHKKNDENYFDACKGALVISAGVGLASFAFPTLLFLLLLTSAFTLVFGGLGIFTKLSMFFYNKQNQRLEKIRSETKDETLQEEIDFYLNRKAICPKELLEGEHLKLPSDKTNIPKNYMPLILENEDCFNISRLSRETSNRNPGFKANSTHNQLFMKKVAAKDGLYEVAAREMAELLGFENIVPPNTIAKADTPLHIENTQSTPNTGLVLSREKIRSTFNQNSPGVQNLVAKFIFKLKAAANQTKVLSGEHFDLLYIQKLIPNAKDGSKIYNRLFNQHTHLAEWKKIERRKKSETIIKTIDISSFQKNFLLHLLLGSQDVNPGNTLFTNGPNGTVLLHSIDHERIMPEDNYNVTKSIPICSLGERDIKNIYPIRLWLAGLPQANVPFTREILENTIHSMSPQHLLAYHRQKKLFSPVAVGAQLDRVLLMLELFKEEIKKSSITLTPKMLFKKLIDNHPSYTALKDKFKLSDFHTFSLLGQLPKNIEDNQAEEALEKVERGKRISFSTSSTRHALFSYMAYAAKNCDTKNPAAIEILSETSKQLTANH